MSNLGFTRHLVSKGGLVEGPPLHPFLDLDLPQLSHYLEDDYPDYCHEDHNLKLLPPAHSLKQNDPETVKDQERLESPVTEIGQLALT